MQTKAKKSKTKLPKGASLYNWEDKPKPKVVREPTLGLRVDRTRGVQVDYLDKFTDDTWVPVEELYHVRKLVLRELKKFTKYLFNNLAVRVRGEPRNHNLLLEFGAGEAEVYSPVCVVNIPFKTIERLRKQEFGESK